nr:glycosyltransferase [Methylomarinum sp. Ch1-1]MDP4522860.1 glycosyltransferase [Methylomarinum sp. Ch1-1]
MNSEEFPLVTIVTPTYNQAEYLAETIESILAQTYPNIEYIVINDGSTDHTEEVLNLYRERVTCITQENMGQSATLNKGWTIAKGKFIGYLSSDDILYPDAISCLVDALKEADLKKLGVFYGSFNIITQSGRIVKKIEPEKYSKSRLQIDLICQPGLRCHFCQGTV